MRTIKYRGMDEHGCWHVGWLAGTNDGFIYIIENDEGWTDDGFHNDDFSGCYKVLDKTIGQFTGLLDKNGKEIYEGDIVKTKGGWGGVVLWNSRSYFYIKDNNYYEYEEPDLSPIGSLLCCERKQLEIVGNIHDNPELLKTETL